MRRPSPAWTRLHRKLEKMVSQPKVGSQPKVVSQPKPLSQRKPPAATTTRTERATSASTRTRPHIVALAPPAPHTPLETIGPSDVSYDKLSAAGVGRAQRPFLNEQHIHPRGSVGKPSSETYSRQGGLRPHGRPRHYLGPGKSDLLVLCRKATANQRACPRPDAKRLAWKPEGTLGVQFSLRRII